MAEGRAWLGLRRRIFLTAVVSSVLVVAPLTVLLLRVVTRAVFETQFRPGMPGVEAQTQTCMADGPGGVQVPDGPVLGAFYEEDSGRSLDPRAAPLWPELFQQIQAGGDYASAVSLRPDRGGQILFRTSGSGACGLMAVTWSPNHARRKGVLKRLLLAVAATSTFGLILAQIIAVGPLLRRLNRLAREADQVGSAAFEPLPEPGADAIARVQEKLHLAHARILRDERALLAHSEALKNHLDAVSHDLRTPLAALHLQLEAISRGRTLEQSQALSQQALSELGYLLGLGDNLRQAARLQHGADPLLTRVPVDLSQVVARVETRFLRLGQARGIQVGAARPSAPVWVRCEASMAEQVLSNLVQNAVSAGRRGGHVAVRLDVDGERFHLWVLDDGPGLPKGVRERLESAAEPDFGTSRAAGGLGLAIVGEIVRRAGWTLALSASNEPGASFHISGPTWTPEGPTGPLPEAEARGVCG